MISAGQAPARLRMPRTGQWLLAGRGVLRNCQRLSWSLSASVVVACLADRLEVELAMASRT